MFDLEGSEIFFYVSCGLLFLLKPLKHEVGLFIYLTAAETPVITDCQ